MAIDSARSLLQDMQSTSFLNGCLFFKRMEINENVYKLLKNEEWYLITSHYRATNNSSLGRRRKICHTLHQHVQMCQSSEYHWLVLYGAFCNMVYDCITSAIFQATGITEYYIQFPQLILVRIVSHQKNYFLVALH